MYNRYCTHTILQLYVLMKNCAPVCILPHGFGSCLGSLKHSLSGVACRAVSGIDVSVKPVCLRL